MARKEVGFVVTDDYKTWIEEVKNKIRNSQIKASVRINYEMLDLYWNLGVAICEKQNKAKFAKSLSWSVWFFGRKSKTYSLLV